MGKKNKENDAIGWLVVISLDKLTKVNNALPDKNYSASCISEYAETIRKSTINLLDPDCTNCLKLSDCALEKNIFSSSHRTHVTENQNEALIIGLVEL